MRVPELLEALNQRDVQWGIANEAVQNSTAFLEAITKSSEWHSKIVSTPGVDRLSLICAASGKSLDFPSVNEMYAKMALAGDLNAVKKMSVEAFAAAVETVDTKSNASPNHRTHSPAEIYRGIGCSDTTLRAFAKVAGVTNRPKKKSERYSHDDYIAILNHVATEATDRDFIRNANRLLTEVKPEVFPNSRNKPEVV